MSKNTKGKLSDDNKTQTKIDKFFPKQIRVIQIINLLKNQKVLI